MTIEDVFVPGPADAPDVRVRLYRPIEIPRLAPALLWIHGGGFVLGYPEQDERGSIEFARELGITVAAVRYRLAPDHPFPAPLEDCYAALRWLYANAERLGIDADRIAIGGASAGGGLAAGLALLAHDRKEVNVAFQLLVYPMLDDRTVLRTDVDESGFRMWNQRSNRYGWSAYLARDPVAADVPAYAAPARREDLSGLPPAWIGVGTLDLFHDEDIAYAKRLAARGVPCDTEIVEGAFHAFDVFFWRTGVARAFRASQVAALKRALSETRGSSRVTA